MKKKKKDQRKYKTIHNFIITDKHATEKCVNSSKRAKELTNRYIIFKIRLRVQ
jgi:hypothetical protein